jgi:hypothetical protein
MQSLSSAIQSQFYKDGYQEDLIERIKELEPDAKIIDITVSNLEKRLKKLQDKIESNE